MRLFLGRGYGGNAFFSPEKKGSPHRKKEKTCGFFREGVWGMTLFSPEKRVSPKKKKVWGKALFSPEKRAFPKKKRETFLGRGFRGNSFFFEKRVPPKRGKPFSLENFVVALK